MRCFAFAQSWKDRGGRVTFVTDCESDTLRHSIHEDGFDMIGIEKTHPDPNDLRSTLEIVSDISQQDSKPGPWVILDGYHFTPDYQRAIKETCRLLVIDDIAHLDHYHAHILVNQNIHASRLAYSCNGDTVKLLGRDFVLLRREFLEYRNWKRRIPKEAKNILVTVGGADSRNVTLKVIHALHELNDPDLEARILVGPSNPNEEALADAVRHAACNMRLIRDVKGMPGLMVWADVAVSAAGSTCWELCFMGLPSLIITVAENQRGVGSCLEEAGAAAHLGWFEDLTVESIAESCSVLLHSLLMRKRLSEAGRRLVRGDGADKILASMENPA